MARRSTSPTSPRVSRTSPPHAGVADEEVDRVVPAADVGDLRERRQEAALEQPRPRRGASRVDLGEERAALASVGRPHELEVGLGDLVEGEGLAEGVVDEARHRQDATALARAWRSRGTGRPHVALRTRRSRRAPRQPSAARRGSPRPARRRAVPGRRPHRRRATAPQRGTWRFPRRTPDRRGPRGGRAARARTSRPPRRATRKRATHRWKGRARRGRTRHRGPCGPRRRCRGSTGASMPAKVVVGDARGGDADDLARDDSLDLGGVGHLLADGDLEPQVEEALDVAARGVVRHVLGHRDLGRRRPCCGP